jgi:hypothetical protein
MSDYRSCSWGVFDFGPRHANMHRKIVPEPTLVRAGVGMARRASNGPEYRVTRECAPGIADLQIGPGRLKLRPRADAGRLPGAQVST